MLRFGGTNELDLSGNFGGKAIFSHHSQPLAPGGAAARAARRAGENQSHMESQRRLFLNIENLGIFS